MEIVEQLFCSYTGWYFLSLIVMILIYVQDDFKRKGVITLGCFEDGTILAMIIPIINTIAAVTVLVSVFKDMIDHHRNMMR